ncbi:MAG TPA: mannosyltransferase family protein [Patescibacteria group bacterium]|nr:mannosyltransferase family protein [Patescibacteria group bacterium]
MRKPFHIERNFPHHSLVRAILGWGGILLLAYVLGNFFILQRVGYLGVTPLANFDGVHYLSIAQHGYFQFEQAFFPLFPLLIALLTRLSHLSYFASGEFVVVTSLIFALVYFWKLVRIDFSSEKSDLAVVFLLLFPTAFYLASIYTESLFLGLVFASLYYLRRKMLLVASLLGLLASATRVVGVLLVIPFAVELHWLCDQKSLLSWVTIKRFYPLLIIPLGLLGYMGFLWEKYQDPLLFFHSQSAFGANRSSGKIILLPQVLFRYTKIFLTVTPHSIDFWIALLEMITLVLVGIGIFWAWKAKIRLSYILFSASSLLLPTLTGTLSGLPRYALASFVIFIWLGQLQSKTGKIIVMILFLLLQLILVALFFRGYYIA